MMPKISTAFLIVAMTAASPWASHAAETDAAPSFRITLDNSVAEAPITGRLFVFLSSSDRREPRFGPSWFDPEPFFGIDVSDFRPGESRKIDDRAAGYPDIVSKIPAGTYQAQAILDHDFYEQHHAYGVGNLYSDVATVEIDPAEPRTFGLTLNHLVEPRTFGLTLNHLVEPPDFPEGDLLRRIEIPSRRLTEFHGREVRMQAAVALPQSYEIETDKRYPVVYAIAGFGGRLESMARAYRDGAPAAEEGEVEFIYVLLSGNCKWGHHVYADSATNGPRGTALVEELIPYVDATFRTVPDSTARFVTGHSSGGWSSLWLQVTYPDTFGGVWSTSPDPVDFRDYQQVDLYADPPLSLYFDEQDERRPLARRGETPVIWYETFGRMDDVLGRGGQLRSFEAVFSPLDVDGAPQKLWERAAGRIDPAVAEAWKQYDIRLCLERNWDRLEPKLRGKLHIITGELDTFYLEGAVERLAESLKQLGSDAEITILPGRNHSNVRTAKLRAQMRRQMSEKFRVHRLAKAAEAVLGK